MCAGLPTTEMSKGLEKEEGAEVLLSPGGTERGPNLTKQPHCLALPLESWGTDPRTPKRDLAYWLPGDISAPNTSTPVGQA